MKPAALIYNPCAGRGVAPQRVARLIGILRSGGWEAEPMATTGRGDATTLARRSAENGAAGIFVYGGDGTLREAAAGVLGLQQPLGFLPGGTASVMRRELGLPKSPEAAARALTRAEPRPWDVGLCNGEPFLMQASAGLDAAIMAGLSSRAKRLFGVAAVLWPGLRVWWRYPYPRLRLVADGEPLAGSLMVAANIPRYGGPWRILPAARSDDRRIELLVFEGPGRLASMGFAFDLFLGRGRHLRRDDIESRTVARVELLGPAELPVQVDGDLLPFAPPLEIRLAAERVQLLSAKRAGQV
jgi:diacylglycerol kinase family enzyme